MISMVGLFSVHLSISIVIYEWAIIKFMKGDGLHNVIFSDTVWNVKQNSYGAWDDICLVAHNKIHDGALCEIYLPCKAHIISSALGACMMATR